MTEFSQDKKVLGNIIGVVITKSDINMIRMFTLRKNNSDIEYNHYDYFCNLDEAKNFISKQNFYCYKKDMLITDYIVIPKIAIINTFINKKDNNYEVFISTVRNDKFFVSYFDNLKEAEEMENTIQKIMEQNIEALDKEMISLVKRMNEIMLTKNTIVASKRQNFENVNLSVSSFSQPSVTPFIIQQNEQTTLNTNNMTNNNTKKKIVSNKGKSKLVEYDDSPLEEIDISKIENIDIFSKIVDEVINRIKIDSDYGTTFADISKAVYDKLDNRKYKKLGDRETSYLMNKLREKFPGKLLKRTMQYGLYDTNTNTHSTGTSVFEGLKFEDRPRLLPKYLRK